MKKEKEINVINFPSKLLDGEREVEAIIFAAAEPLYIETICRWCLRDWRPPGVLPSGLARTLPSLILGELYTIS